MEKVVCRLASKLARCDSLNWSRSQIRHARYVPTKKLPTPFTEKRLDVVILGYPNVGKSTLLNALVETQLAATTRKKHTTRGEILGVFNHRNVQLAFYDTPGFVQDIESSREFTSQLRKIAAASTLKADVILLVVDASIGTSNPRYQSAFTEMVKLALDNAKTEIVLVLNKVDLVIPKSNLLDTTFTLVSLINGVKLGPDGAAKAILDTTTFMIAATEDDGILDLKNYLLAVAKPKKWTIPKIKDKQSSAVTDMSNEERVQETVLEMMLENTHDEIPYIARIDCRSINDLNITRCRVEVDIIVDTKRQQKIVIGHNGRTLVKIRSAAVSRLQSILDKEVILILNILVRDDDKIEDEIE